MLDLIGKTADTVIKVVIAVGVVSIADKVGLFTPVKKWWKKVEEEAE